MHSRRFVEQRNFTPENLRSNIDKNHKKVKEVFPGRVSFPGEYFRQEIFLQNISQREKFKPNSHKINCITIPEGNGLLLFLSLRKKLIKIFLDFSLRVLYLYEVMF